MMGESRSFGFTCCWIPGIVNAAHVDLRSLLMQGGSPLCRQDPDAHRSGHWGPGLRKGTAAMGNPARGSHLPWLNTSPFSA